MQRKRTKFPRREVNTNKELLTEITPSSVESVAPRPRGNIDHLLPVPTLSFASCSFVIVIFSMMCYWPSVQGGFVFDDSEAIVNNKDILNDVPMSEIFYHDFWGSDVSSNLSHKSYRPLTTLTFKLNFYLARGMHPWGFHLVNIIVHMANCVLFVVLFDRLFEASFLYGPEPINMLSKTRRIRLNFPKASLLSALLFAVHPVHTESVCGIVGRAELLSALMFSLALLGYMKSCEQGVKPGMCDFRMLLFLVISIAFAALAMLFKEQGITVLAMCCMYDVVLMLHRRSSEKSDLTKNKNKISNFRNQGYVEQQRFTVRPFICRQLFLVCCGVFMIYARFCVMGKTAPNFKPIDNPTSFQESFILRVINYNYIYSLNLWLLIFPWWLCFDWSMGCVPLITNLNDPRILAPVVMWIVFFYFTSCVIRSRQNSSIFLLAVSFLVIPFLPASNIFFQVGFVVAERVLYLSTGGYCILFVLAMAYISKHANVKVSFVLIYGCLLFFILRSIYRSTEWVSEETLFMSGAEVCPLNAKVHYNIGKIKADRNNITEALKYYNEAIRLYPDYDQAYNNIGNLLQSTGDSLGAENAFQKALTIRPTFAAVWMNLGITKSSLGKYQEAEECYLKALAYRKSYADAHYNLGNMYIDWKKPEKAVGQFKKSFSIDPFKEKAWNNLIILMENTGELKKAALVSSEALEVLPNSPGLHFTFGNILGKLKRFEQSENHFLRAIRLDTLNPSYYGNLGVLYHRWGKLSEAEKSYMKALEFNPSNQMVRENLAKLQEKTRKHTRQAIGD